MHERLFQWRRLGVLLCVGALALGTAVAAPPQSGDAPDRPTPLTQSDDGDASSAARDRAQFPRTVAWWPYNEGPRYGAVAQEERRSPDVIHTMVGSYRIGTGLDLPAELRGDRAGLDQGRAQHFIVQATPSGAGELETALQSAGARIVMHLPVNAVVARMDNAVYGAISALSIVQHIEPFHPALKIDPRVGKTPQPTKAEAASPNFDLQIDLFLGEPTAPVVAALEGMGAQIVNVIDGRSPRIRARLHASRIVDVAKIEAVESIHDHQPVQLLSEGSLFLQSGTATVGDFPFWKVGLDGDGQLIHQTDSGMSVDAGDHAHTNSNSGWDTSDPRNCNVIDGHRQVICYRTAGELGGSGDLSACGSVTSGAFTHGQLTSGVAMGNATRGKVPAPTNPSPTDDPDDPNKTWTEQYGDGIFIDENGDGLFEENRDTAYDGIAKGARIVFHDAETTCPEGDPLAGGLLPGSEFNNVDVPYNEFGTNLHSFSWGSGGGDTVPTYGAGADGFDQAVLDNPINLVMVSAGNDGATDEAENGRSDVPGTVNNQATLKNGFAIGASQGVGGGIAFYSSEGPPGEASSESPNLRVTPLLVAEGGGPGLQEYGCRSEDGNDVEDQVGEVNCVRFASQGTSFAAPNAIGAAAIVGEYLAQGFYPDGTDNNSNNDDEKVGAVASSLTKAILVAGAAPMGNARSSDQRRFNNVYGYGRIQLDNTLPLADFPNDTPSGMILHDLPGDVNGDGQADGVSNLSLPGSLTSGQTETVQFDVVAENEDLAVALVWHDPVSSDGSLVRDLDLTVTYCGEDGTCGSGGDDIVWFGNAFSEDFDRDTVNESDLDSDGSIDSYDYSMSQQFVEGSAAPGTYSNWRDTANNVEAVYVPFEANQPPGKDTFDIVASGKYELEITYSSGTGSTPFSIAIIGPVAAGSSVRFDRNPVACNGLQDVTVTEVEDTEDPSCTDAQNCPPSVISSRTTINVYDETNTLVDQETDLAFTQQGSATPGTEDDELRYTLTDDIALSDVTAFEFNDGFLSVANAYTLEVIYQDEAGAEIVERVSQAGVDCQPDLALADISQLGQNAEFELEGGCDTDNYLDQNESFSFVANYTNTDPVDLIDAEISLAACEHRTDPTPENCTPLDAITVYDPVRALGLLPSGSTQFSRFTIEVTGIPTARQMVDIDLCLAGEKTGQPVAACKTFTLLAQADDENHFYITDCPDGCSGVRYDRNNDEVYEERIARNPFDALDLVRRGLAEKNINYEPLRDAADENNNGTPDCEEGENAGKGFVCGNPNFSGPWDFESDREGFTTGVYELSEDRDISPGISNFGEDSNWNDTNDTDEPDEDPSKIGSSFTIDYNWGTAGGCGWASSADGNPGGMFHTGTIGNWDATHETRECWSGGDLNPESICEPYDVYAGTAGEKFWFEFLRTPEIHPVHFGTDPRDGFDWRTQILDYSWAMQWDSANSTIWTWEFDLDTADAEVTLGDNTVGGLFGGDTGLIQGGNLPLFDGALVFAPTDDNAGTSNYGNERIGTIGGNRNARRGCWFNGLDGITLTNLNSAGDRPVNIPLPADDDCDNEFDLGADGCPGTCGVDDDGNGAVDDPQEICPCKTCEDGPRAGRPCVVDGNCNPEAGASTYYDCVLDVDSNGVPTGYGDDVCGGAGDPDDGSPSPDEGVFSSFDLASNSERVLRNGTPELGNGIASSGRPAGSFRFNTLEDFFDPVGSSWQAEIGFLVLEPEGEAQEDSYGMGVDEVVVEWMESKPIDQTEDKCGVSGPGGEEFEGRCARVTLAEESNTFAGDRRLEVSVLDPVPTGNITTCEGGERGIEVIAFSQAEPDGETLCLPETATDGNHFAGLVETTTRIRKPGDGLVYTDFNGLDTPTVTVRYIDKNDGKHATDNGPDGQPGIAGFDDDGDGQTDEADELCPTVSELAAGRTPHAPGQPSRYSDDNCGCLDNPLQTTTVTQFDVADVVVEEVQITDDGDNDGWADPGEQVTVSVVLRNLADFAIEDIVLRAATDSQKVSCFTKDTVKVDRVEPRESNCFTPDPNVCADRISGTFTFIAADVSRGDIAEEFRSELALTLNALAKATPLSQNAGRRAPRDADRIQEFDIPISGFAVRQTIEVEHNLDISGSEGSATTFTEGFESYDSDETGSQPLFAAWAPKTEGAGSGELDGNRCQYNDPFNPFGNNTEPEEFCEVGEGTDNSINDWHLSSTEGCDSQGLPTGCPPGAGNNAIKAKTGLQAMSMNWLNWSNVSFIDNKMSYHANRLQWIEKTEAVQLRASGDENGDPPKMSLWTIVSLVDGRTFNVAAPGMLDSAVTGICVDRNGNDQCDTVLDGDGSERWEVIDPKINPYSGWKFPNFINCAYDPTDDGSTEDDFFAGSQRFGPSSACFPQLSESCLGRSADDTAFGTTWTSSTCFPETGEYDVTVTDLYEFGNVGTGVWAKQVYDLGEYAGQKILIRFLTTPTGVQGVDIWGPAFQGLNNGDDGWYIDDIEITGVSTTEFGIAVDNTGGGAGQTCPAENCEAATSRAAVLPYPRNDRNGNPRPAAACTDTGLDFCDFDDDGTADAGSSTAVSPAPRQPFTIEARESETDTCFGGALQFRFSDATTGEVFSDWSTRQDILVDPTVTTTYDVSVRCSTQESCSSTQQVTIEVPEYTPRDVCLTSDLVFQSDKQTFNWQQSPNDACSLIFDVAKGTSFGSAFFNNQSCLEDDDTDTQASDPNDPAAGNGFWYASRHAESGSYESGGGGEEPGRDDNITACP